jgi:uncharacterized membrane protein (UPF0127 family)
MLVRYQELKGIELYAYQVNEDLYNYNLNDSPGCMESLEFREAKKHMNKWKRVVRAAVYWVERPLAVSCHVANTVEEKKCGLQNTSRLDRREGMYFPYNPTADVTFHQGSVTYPLDILFIRNDQIVSIEQKTKVGSKDTWSCPCCDGVLEVKGGFCEENGVQVGDYLAFFGLTKEDLRQLKAEKEKESEPFSANFENYMASMIM